MVTRLIDIHPHIISPDTERYPISPLGGKRSSWSEEHPATFEELIKAMDEAGVDKAAIVHSSTTYGYDNSYVADAIAAHPERFDGVFSVDILADDAPQKIDYWARDRQLGGLRIFTTGSTMRGQAPILNDARIHPGWRAAGEAGLPICAQITAAAIPDLEKLLQQYPDFPVIIDHMLKPDISEGPPYDKARPMLSLARYPNVYLKMTDRNTVMAKEGKATPQSWFGLVVKEFGANRIAWGSNWPSSDGTLAEIAQDLRDSIAFLPAEDQHWIMAGTAMKLYPRLAD
ncbi:amidohydrolase family protein [Paucibacter sp. R3-3]|uniref:Amidohydrolase family protein n=1 Tax=Roseateles agri TaxID=3098619 RepID=A0ABU5DIC0_9BURK|nr:amidohydrolase family protein [Paucibacter sp. R3-3]MDY0746053.1 amidohydrolase family protein [Paucibacter sp. R3-3]